MSIRLPLQALVQDLRPTETGTSSVGGTINIPVTLPQDTDNVVVKLVASVAGAGVSAQLQTTDDGGTTWYGIGRTSVVSNAVGDNAQWISATVIGTGLASSSLVAVGSVVAGNGIGSAQPSTLSSGDLSGMPILSPTARVALQIMGNITAAASNIITTTVSANSQGARQ